MLTSGASYPHLPYMMKSGHMSVCSATFFKCVVFLHKTMNETDCCQMVAVHDSMQMMPNRQS